MEKPFRKMWFQPHSQTGGRPAASISASVFTKATLPVAAPAVLKTAPAAPVEASDDFDTGEEE